MRPIDAEKFDMIDYSRAEVRARGYEDLFDDGVRWLAEQLDNAPTLNVAPVVHGEWMWDADGVDWGIGSWRCKNCHERPNTYWQYDRIINPLRFAGSRYCPNCGAVMDGKDKIDGR